MNGDLQVEIPQTVLVHKYYYSGDRSFQAQLLPGGPSIIVANHPRTGDRCYIDVQLPPGAPRVIYTGHSIEYDYDKQGVTVCFKRFGDPKVTYRNSVPVGRMVSAVSHAVSSGTIHLVQSTGVPEGVGTVAHAAESLVINTSGYAYSAGKQLSAPVVGLAKSTPIGSLFKRDPAKEADCARQHAVKRAQHQDQLLNETIQTVR
jgi:hypothetical protein